MVALNFDVSCKAFSITSIEKKFMVAIHEYLVTITDKKTQNDDLGTRIAKTLINEIVKLKREHIWDYYHVIENHPQPDNHL